MNSKILRQVFYCRDWSPGVKFGVYEKEWVCSWGKILKCIENPFSVSADNATIFRVPIRKYFYDDVLLAGFITGIIDLSNIDDIQKFDYALIEDYFSQPKEEEAPF